MTLQQQFAPLWNLDLVLKQGVVILLRRQLIRATVLDSMEANRVTARKGIVLRKPQERVARLCNRVVVSKEGQMKLRSADDAAVTYSFTGQIKEVTLGVLQRLQSTH